MHPKEMDLKGLPFFTGVAIYCYEGAGMILSLEASIAKDYRSRFKVSLLLSGNETYESFSLFFQWQLWQ